jgi:TonB family protein
MRLDMRAPPTLKAFLLAAIPSAVFCASALSSPSSLAAQSGRSGEQPSLRLIRDDVERGKKLLAEGDTQGAIKILREVTGKNKDEDAAWHHLGVALASAGQSSEALKALERALELRSRAFNFEVNEQRNADAEWSPGDSSRLRARFAARTGALIESVEAFAALGPEDAELWQEWLAALRLYAQVAADPKFETEPFRLAALITKAAILSKPEPGYTERARRGKISGLVRVRALLGADGKVKGVTVIRGLGGGLSEKAIEAARRIRFTPASVGGRPVSQFVTLEYNFLVF